MQINPAEFKLLVVDDVQTNVLLLKALLGKEGYGILVANNGQEALEVIRKENPRLDIAGCYDARNGGIRGG